MSNETLGLSADLQKYLIQHCVSENRIQTQLREHTATLEWSQMQIAPEQGQFMAFLIKLLGVRKIIEVGVFTGYSSLAMALALPDDGQIIACDNNKEWTGIAKSYWKKAGVAHKVDLKLGDALDSLKKMLQAGQRSQFDMAFIDADKTNYRNYYEFCLKLLRKNGLILVDNTLWGGSVVDRLKTDEDTQAIRAFNDFVYQDRRVEQCMLPLADGLTLVRKCV